MNSIEAPASAAGERIDVYLARILDQPRNRVQSLLRRGLVTAGGSALKPSYVLRGGEEIAYRLPPPPSEQPLAEAGPVSVIHEDEDLLIVDKPAGLIVHPGSGVPGGTLVNRLLHHRPGHRRRRVRANGRGIVHRLDAGTSGALAVACSDAAYRRLSRAFAEREVGKVYLAVVYGRPEPPQGEVALPIGRDPAVRTRMTVVSESRGGRPAVSRYRLLAGTAGVSLLELEILTGRTHQIRVHCKAIGHPLVGDPTYGEARWRNVEPSMRRPLREFARPGPPCTAAHAAGVRRHTLSRLHRSGARGLSEPVRGLPPGSGIADRSSGVAPDRRQRSRNSDLASRPIASVPLISILPLQIPPSAMDTRGAVRSPSTEPEDSTSIFSEARMSPFTWPET